MLGMNTGPLLGRELESRADDQKIATQPWMKDFVQERHTREEWDAFMAYCQAGPWKRAAIWLRNIIAWWAFR